MGDKIQEVLATKQGPRMMTNAAIMVLACAAIMILTGTTVPAPLAAGTTIHGTMSLADLGKVTVPFALWAAAVIVFMIVEFRAFARLIVATARTGREIRTRREGGDPSWH